MTTLTVDVYGRSKPLPHLKTIIWLLLLLMSGFMFVFLSSVVLAEALGGNISEKLINRSGVADSQLVIGRSGVDNSSLDVGLGVVISTLTPVNSATEGTRQVTLRGNVSNMNNFPSATVWFEWGYDTSYGTTVGTQAITTTGIYTTDLSGYDGGRVIHYRFVSSADGTLYGGDQTFIASDSAVFNLMHYLVPLLFVVLLIVLLLGLTNSGLSFVQVILIGGILIYMGIYFLQDIVVFLQNIW